MVPSRSMKKCPVAGVAWAARICWSTSVIWKPSRRFSSSLASIGWRAAGSSPVGLTRTAPNSSGVTRRGQSEGAVGGGLRVGGQDDRRRAVLEVEPGAVEGGVDDGQGLDSRGFEFFLHGAQLHELAAAEGSVEPTEEAQQHALLAAEIRERHAALAV